MHFNLEKLEQNVVALEVTVKPDEVEDALKESYKKVVRKVELPGFRKGHVPRHILERHFGKEVLYEEATNIMVTKGYLEGLSSHGLRPIDQPRLEIIKDFADNEPFVFKMTLETMPEVNLGAYKGLEIPYPEVAVDDEMVNERLKSIQERHAELVFSERQELEKGDFAVIDFEGYIAGEPFPGGAAEGYTLEIGSGNFVPGFEEKLIGMTVGSIREITVAFPADYTNEELAGKDADYKVTLKEIKVKEIPALDDEFAKSLGSYENLEGLKNDLKARMFSMKEQEAENNYVQAVIDAAVDNAETLIPGVMVEREKERMLERLEHRFMDQGITLEHYLAYTKKTREETMEEFQPQAEKKVKTSLVLDAIAEAEKLSVAEEELDQKIRELAVMYQQKDPVRFKQELAKRDQLEALRDNMLVEKTVEFLKNNAVKK